MANISVAINQNSILTDVFEMTNDTQVQIGLVDFVYYVYDFNKTFNTLYV